MPRWTEAQVTKLAPDDSSVTAARRLTNPALWSDTGSTEILVWGKCQGSGKSPYQVSVDLAGPAFRCSCPSRKFPCKHALALLLLWVRGGGAVADAEQAAAFAQEWADGRDEKSGAHEVPQPHAEVVEAGAHQGEPFLQALGLGRRIRRASGLGAGLARTRLLGPAVGPLLGERRGLVGVRDRAPAAYPEQQQRQRVLAGELAARVRGGPGRRTYPDHRDPEGAVGAVVPCI